MIKQIRRMKKTALLLCLMLPVFFLMPFGVHAQESENIVRVGWYESPFNTTDQLERRSGYAYDYQQEIAAYTGWTYEYVEGSWSDLLEMLENGRIDLLSDVSYTDERAEKMLYSSLPMGAEEYYLFISAGNSEITPEDYSTFNGKKVGVNKGSIQIGMFRNWAESNGIRAEIVELNGTEDENLTKLLRGDIDMYLSLDGFFQDENVVPVCEIGESDFYFAVNKSRPELLTELNNAMSRIRDENPYYTQELYSKYLQTASINRYLSSEEEAWLAGHGTIRVGYQDNYLAFCARDPETGELTGALKDYLSVASDCLENAHLDFEAVCFPTAADAIEAMRNGEVDCVFPANLTPYDGENIGVFTTPTLMHTDMSAIIRREDLDSFAKKDRVTVAVNAGNPNYDMFLLDHFPEWRSIYFDDTQECLKAVADGRADCLLISNYRYNNIAEQCEEYGLASWSTGVEMDYYFAVNRGDTTLYSILAKITGIVPQSTVNAALTYYYTEDARLGMNDLRRENLIILIIIIAVAAVIAILLVRAAIRWKQARSLRQPDPAAEDFRLFYDLPVSYSVYHVTHTEYSGLYDAEIIYVNRKYEEYGGLPAHSVIGHSVRELYPHIGEDWFQNVRLAAIEGQTVESVFRDELSGKQFNFTVRQIIRPGYCAVTYMVL